MPSNDFHGKFENINQAISEIQTSDYRIVSSPHHNHQDTPEFEVATLLWFNQHFKKSYQFPATPVAKLAPLVKGKAVTFTVAPDLAESAKSVDIYYTRAGKGDNAHTINRFWFHAKATRQGDIWEATIPLDDSTRPLWIYANVTYPLPKTMEGVGYYFTPYKSDIVTISTPLTMVTAAKLKSSGVLMDLKPNNVIESFGKGWEKEWFSYGKRGWGICTHKLNAPFYALPEGATLSIEIKSVQPNVMIIAIDEYYCELNLKGSNSWQKFTFTVDDFKTITGEPLKSWAKGKELKLQPFEILKDGKTNKTVGSRDWKGSKPTFRNLQK